MYHRLMERGTVAILPRSCYVMLRDMAFKFLKIIVLSSITLTVTQMHTLGRFSNGYVESKSGGSESNHSYKYTSVEQKSRMRSWPWALKVKIKSKGWSCHLECGTAESWN